MRTKNFQVNLLAPEFVEKNAVEKLLNSSNLFNFVNVEERKRVNHKIIVYVHLTDVNDYHESINREIIDRVIESGLINYAHLKLFCHYRWDSFSWLRDLFAGFDNVEFFYPNVLPSDYETQTINHIRRDCLEFENEQLVLYLHSKGITRPTSQPSIDWRRYLLHFNVDRWEDNVALLESGRYDTVGVNLLETPMLHYSGNFWWSKSSYIKRLNELSPLTNRHYAEMWICSGNPFACEVFDSKIRHFDYDTEYPEHRYKIQFRNNLYIAGYQVGELLKGQNNLTGIELGCAFGVTTEYLLSKLDGVLHGIDPYENYVDWNRDVLDNEVNGRNINELYARVRKFGNRFILHKKFSDDAVNDFDDASIDYIFIDGLHTYEQVLKDCVNYYPKIKSGGLFSGHDYHVIAEVRRAVDEFAARVGATVKTGSNDVWYWFKEEKTP